jgi:hypothetical protein
MTVNSADLGHARARISMPATSPVPILEENAFTNSTAGAVLAGPRTGLWPVFALGIAIAATLVWNGFLFWEFAKLVAGWVVSVL